VRIVILSDAVSVAEFAAEEMAAAISSKATSVLGLATGGTPVGAYRQLIELYKNRRLSFSEVTTFNLDEYIGLSPDHPASYRYFMNENLFRHIDVQIKSTHIPLGDVSDLIAECCNYEARIERAGGLDLQLLGIGTDGHIGFNEPGSSLAGRTRVKTLTEQTRRDNARYFSSLDEVPTSAITMGIGTILEAKRILLLATGSNKADAIRAAVEGPLTTSVPASALQLHSATVVVVDEAAAAKLDRHDYYRRSELEGRRLGLIR
jgi:glucosamine-6-phosphate deaminase